MATHKQGVLGKFSGSIGAVVGSSYKGQGVMKIKPATVKNRNSPAQLRQRQRFGLIMQFLLHAKPIVDLGFERVSPVTSAVNEAVRFNIRNGITGEYPDAFLNYPELVVTRGNLSGAKGAGMTLTEESELSITWMDTTGRSSASADDLAMLMVFNPVQDEAIFSLLEFQRVEKSMLLKLPEDYAGQELHVWLSFRNALGTIASDSLYLGSVTP